MVSALTETAGRRVERLVELSKQVCEIRVEVVAVLGERA
jgi:hypothetical protein